MKKISGRVIKNKGRGKILGFPTANLDTTFDLEEGIYLAVVIKIDGGLPPLMKRELLARKGIMGNSGGGLPALVFIGSVKTFSEKEKKVEVHILDFNFDIYGKNLEVKIIKKIRDNKKFDSAEELVDQMKSDELVARQFFGSYNHFI